MTPYYKREGITLYCGDSLGILPELEESYDACVTDPPYGINYQSAWRIDKTKWKPKISNDGKPFVWWLHSCYTKIKDPGALACFCRWDVAEAFRLSIDWASFDVRSQVIWDRGCHGTGNLKQGFGPQHDIIWFGTKGSFAFPRLRPKSVLKSLRLQGDQLSHPNEKPVDLFMQIYAAIVPDKGCILDPFIGSGASLEAAVLSGFSATGSEIDERYCEIAARRLEKVFDEGPRC